jgi:hypothetical protein
VIVHFRGQDAGNTAPVQSLRIWCHSIGLTCAIAAAIASFPFVATGTFVAHWLQSWFVAWIMMLPIVLFAAPAIRSLTHILTRED